MNEKYKLLALLIEVYWKYTHAGWIVHSLEIQEKIKNQIEDSTGLKIEDVLKLHEINKKINWEKIIDRKKDGCKLTLYGRVTKCFNDRKLTNKYRKK